MRHLLQRGALQGEELDGLRRALQQHLLRQVVVACDVAIVGLQGAVGPLVPPARAPPITLETLGGVGLPSRGS